MNPSPYKAPFVVHGSDCSYYTGKIEAYLRAKGIDYRLEMFTPLSMRRCVANTGVRQIPQVECPDGSWLLDTTPTIAYLESVCPEPKLSPADPVVRFVSLLLEDYADVAVATGHALPLVVPLHSEVDERLAGRTPLDDSRSCRVQAGLLAVSAADMVRAT